MISKTLIVAVAFALANVSAIAAPAPAPDAAKVVASQGGVQLTLGDIDAFAEGIPPEHRAPFFDNPKRIATLVGNLLVQKQQAAAARALGLDTSGGTMADRDLARLESEHFRASIQPPDLGELAHEQFLAEPEKYDIPATLSVQKILVTSTARGDADAQARADEARQKAVKDPAAFDALVEEYSDAGDTQRDHGMIKNAERIADPALAAAVKVLAKPGDISPVIKTNDGYSVLKLVAREPRRPQKFEDVRERILESLKSKYIDDAMKTHAAEFNNKPVDADTALMDTLRTRYGQIAAVPATAEKPAKK